MAKKVWTIYPRTKAAQTNGIQTEKGLVTFEGRSSFNTTNEKVVKAINEQHRGEAYTVHDETLSKAMDSGSWDIVKGKKGDYVKSLHNYTFTVPKPKPPAWFDKLKSYLTRHRLTFYLWFWDVDTEKGIRIFGKELTWQK